MKKHKLLEKAMQDYPAGTKFKHINGDDVITSNGIFKIYHGLKVALYNESGDYVFNSEKWATIIPEKPESILTGKCAIQINNDREFKLLMEHYESKGWKCINRLEHNEVDYMKESWAYHDFFGHASDEWRSSNGYKIIPFSDFASEVGIKVPVFIMTSEDGVDLYEGDKYYVASKYKKCGLVLPDTIETDHPVLMFPSTNKAFSTKEAAENWIAEHNKPKEITVQLFNKYHSAKISKGWVSIRVGKGLHVTTTVFKPSDIEEMYTAIKSLQP